MGTGYKRNKSKLHSAHSAVLNLLQRKKYGRKKRAFAALRKVFAPKRAYWKRSVALTRRFKRFGY